MKDCRGELLYAMAENLSDSDVPARTWALKSEAPLGIERPIERGGIFPAVDPGDADDAEDSWVTPQNYKPFEDHRDGAEKLLRQERDAGWMQWYLTQEDLNKACGGTATLSRIGVISKVQGDRIKLRLIHDLRRSGVNSKEVLPERVVLPRLQDARYSILELIEKVEGNDWEIMGLDFSDAFKQIKVAPEERKYLTGKALDGFYKYLTIMFGVKSAPWSGDVTPHC